MRLHAPLPLHSAEEKLESARAAIRGKDYECARRLAVEAEADARLAEVSAQSARNQSAADEIQQSIQTLRQELGVPAKPWVGGNEYDYPDVSVLRRAVGVQCDAPVRMRAGASPDVGGSAEDIRRRG